MDRENKGFSLIEVLVALVLTTVGVLGMVALQGRSVQYAQDSVQRNMAVDLASEYIELIRANPTEIFNKTVPKEAMNSGIKDESIFFKSKGSDFAEAANCVATASKSAQTAKEQRDCWISRMASLLPGADSQFKAQGYICQSSEAGKCDQKGSVLEIRLAWQVREGACLESTDTENKDPFCTYTVRVQP